MLVFDERGKLEYPGENLTCRESREPTNSILIWHRVRKSNPGRIGKASALTTRPPPNARVAWLFLLIRPLITFKELLYSFFFVAGKLETHFPPVDKVALHWWDFFLFCILDNRLQDDPRAKSPTEMQAHEVVGLWFDVSQRFSALCKPRIKRVAQSATKERRGGSGSPSL